MYWYAFDQFPLLLFNMRICIDISIIFQYDIVAVLSNPCHLGYRLGLAYAGSNREDVLSLLLPVMGDSKSSMEV